jgi:hypothetical protein
MRVSIVLHVGYPKAASTWLRETLFSQPGTGFESPWTSESKRELILPDSFHFDPAEARRCFQPGIEAAWQRGGIPVLSDEWLTGNQVTGDYHGREVADRLRETFDEALVLVLLREQKAMILSSYREYVKIGGSLPIEEFLGRGRWNCSFAPICRLEHLEYDRLIRHYRQRFGDERVMAVPVEWLWKHLDGFYEDLKRRCGVQGSCDLRQPARNVGLRGATLRLRALANGLLSPPGFATPRGAVRHQLAQELGNLLGHLATAPTNERFERDLQERVARCAGDAYRESNRRTAEQIGVDLGSWGYDS